MFDLIVMRVAGNGLGPIGGEHISLALMQLTGLQMLDLSGTYVFELLGWGRGLYCGGGREGVCVLR